MGATGVFTMRVFSGSVLEARVLAEWNNAARQSGGAMTGRLCRVDQGFGAYAIVEENSPSAHEQHVPSPFRQPDLQETFSITGHEIYSATDVRLTDLPSGTQLFMPLVNVDPDVEDAFNDWYNHKHVSAVASVGLRDARRYEACTGLHKYFATYVIAAADVLGSAELAEVRGFDEFTDSVADLSRLVLTILS